jgi:hypothetical protein
MRLFIQNEVQQGPLNFCLPLYFIRPNFRNLFMNTLTRGRVVPMSAAKVS